MALTFEHSGSSARIIFGRGSTSRISDVLGALDVCRALILSTDVQKDAAESIAMNLGKKCLGVYAKAQMHTPVTVTNAAMEVIKEQRVDCLISFGGGSTTGLSKAIAYRTDLPQIAVPTTYAGSEVTPILGQTDRGEKTTVRDSRVLPEVVIYDPDWTKSLPLPLSVTSGINAIAHAVEALYAQDRSPISTMMAKEGIAALCEALPQLSRSEADEKVARELALFGSWLCGSVLGQVSMALHHKLCHTIGGLFNLPHAETHTVILPHATAFNAVEVPQLLRPVCEALNSKVPGHALFDLAADLGAPTSLKELGMPKSGIAKVADLAMASAYKNPRTVNREEIEALISAAYHGLPPNG